MTRLKFPVPRWLQLLAAFVAGLAVASLAFVEVGPIPLRQVSHDTVITRQIAEGGTATPSAQPSAAARSASAAGPAAVAGLSCRAGSNGGATAPGVTANTIQLATTEVESGVGAAFLGEVKYAMEAVKNKVNRQGGICGRQLQIRYVDDGWDAQRGSADIQNLVQSGVFAIPVGPSSEGLRIEIDNGDIDRFGIPVVGTDGMLIDQYSDPWVWPVAVSTASSARIMAADAYKRGARSFSIVFDSNYRFGREAGEAYDHEVRRLTGSDIPGYPGDQAVQSSQLGCVQSFCAIEANQSGYGSQAKNMSQNHGDYMAMFLEPATALVWMSDPNAPTVTGTTTAVKYGIGLGQPLFTYGFASNCQDPCDQMDVWTSYKPDLESYATSPAVEQFVQDLHAVNPNADQYNAFSEGGYLGMELLVQALQAAGPDLTRARLKQALDTLSLASGLTYAPNLTWASGDHYANTTMQAFVIQYKGTFGRWRAGDIFTDPDPRGGVS